MLKRAYIFYVIVCWALFSNHATGQATQASSHIIKVYDDLDRLVRLTRPAQSIVSLAPHLSELVFSANAASKLVGVSKHCDYPAAVKNIRIVSDYQTINYEALALLQPDLILVWQAGLTSRQLQTLQKLAPAVYISNAKTFADIRDNLIDIGTLSGLPTHKQATTFMQKIHSLRTRYARARKVPIIYLLWADPPMTITHGHWINTSIELCGGRNVYAELPTTAGNTAILQRESLGLHPQAWVLHHSDHPSYRIHTRTKLFHVPALQRPSLRIAEATAQLCQLIAKLRQTP